MTAVPDRRAAAAAFLRDRAVLRMPMRGRSMLPSLREGMLLQVGDAASARVGDILVFESGDVKVAHRVVALEQGAFRTAGDAQPGTVERVLPHEVVGRVVAVWTDSSATKRVDGLAHRVRGWYYGRFHRLRRRSAMMRRLLADLAVRAQPHRRARGMLRLVDALSAAQSEDSARLADALAATASGLDDAAQRHRCAALLGESARRLGILESLPPSVTASMRRARLDALLATSRLHRAVCTTIDVLHEIGVPFALLKGAARSYAAAPEAAYHISDDVDVLVARADRDRVAKGMLARGYTCTAAISSGKDYGRHHHAEPLYPPDGKFPVEVHHQLAPPGTLSTPTEWPALAPYLQSSGGPCGPVLRLNATGAALHLAIHAIGLGRLRDVALLARALPMLDAAALAELRAVVHAERKDPIRLEASVALAARIAGVPWDAAPGVQRYIRWALLREDLPAVLRARCEAIEQHVAHPGRPLAFVAGLVPWWSRGLGIVLAPGRFAVLCAASAAAIAYAALMPREDRPVS